MSIVARWRLAALVSVALFLVSCASPGRKYDAGVVSHRFVTKVVNPRTKLDEYKLLTKYVSAENYKDFDVIKPGDSVSIRINAIYICDFSENNPFPAAFFMRLQDEFVRSSAKGGDYPGAPCSQRGMTGSKHYTRGEIVVLADVFEQGGGRTIAYTKNGFDSKDARVIYYDDDIRESGQFFSIANIPVYGPIRYAGNALFFRIFMLELDDDENAQNSAMLKKLAELGGKAYPPASPILKTLSSVGDALLSGEQDDLEFRYTMAFDPYPGESKNYLPLAVGDYVVAKQDNRSVDMAWDSGSYDPGTGTASIPVTGARRVTFISFKVSRNEPALQQDGLQLYSEFEATLPAAGMDLAKLDEAADAMKEEFRLAAAMDIARSQVVVLNTSDPGSAEYAQANAGLAETVCHSSAIDTSSTANLLGAAEVEYLLRTLDEECLEDEDHDRKTIAGWTGLCTSGAPVTMCAKS